MNEALEALQQLKEKCANDAGIMRRLEIIEKRLLIGKKYEDSYWDILSAEKENEDEKANRHRIIKLMAFTIIKDKGELFHTKDEDVDHYYLERIYLKKEEYDFLKGAINE